MSNFLSSNPTDLARALETEKRAIEEREAQGRAASLGLQYVNLLNFPLDLTALAVLTEQEAKDCEAVIFHRERKDLKIGTPNPNNPALKAKLAELQKEYKIVVYFVSMSSYTGTMKFYSKVIRPTSNFQDVISFGDNQQEKDLQALMQKTGATASDVLSATFGVAVLQSASDIHLEPEEHMVKVRLRIDGVLHDAAQMPKTLYTGVISRIKLLAKLKLNVNNVSQDGRFTVMHNNEPLDVRVSVLPSSFGEAVVMRLLGIGAVDVTVAELMIQGRAGEVVNEQLHKPNGMILTTGPTGSGKTTTLYAFLKELNDPGVKIITLEDPVEYKVEGIQQTPIDHRVDFNFAKGLRAVLRQDPDVVMVGEIRDPETAEVALQAALTGHVVLSTLHTNDASGAVPRLVTMGVKPFTIAPAVNAVLAQRLVRRICQKCMKPAEVLPATLEKVEKLLNDIPKAANVTVPRNASGKLEFYHSSGCDACGGLGYKGRMGVYEVIEINDPMRELILKEASILDIKKLAVENGTMSMAQDGLLKALQKLTDIEEVFRVVG